MDKKTIMVGILIATAIYAAAEGVITTEVGDLLVKPVNNIVLKPQAGNVRIEGANLYKCVKQQSVCTSDTGLFTIDLSGADSSKHQGFIEVCSTSKYLDQFGAICHKIAYGNYGSTIIMFDFENKREEYAGYALEYIKFTPENNKIVVSAKQGRGGCRYSIHSLEVTGTYNNITGC